MTTRLAGLLGLLLIMFACGGTEIDVSNVPDLPDVTVAEFEGLIDSLDRPAVVNVWASWCIPCRSEAPLLRSAFNKHGDDVLFIGIDVQDNQEDAKRFVAEFRQPFDSFFDPRRSIPNRYGAIGTPVTMFFASDGVLVSTHNGVIDEMALAIGIDELLRRD